MSLVKSVRGIEKAGKEANTKIFFLNVAYNVSVGEYNTTAGVTFMYITTIKDGLRNIRIKTIKNSLGLQGKVLTQIREEAEAMYKNSTANKPKKTVIKPANKQPSKSDSKQSSSDNVIDDILNM